MVGRLQGSSAWKWISLARLGKRREDREGRQQLTQSMVLEVYPGSSQNTTRNYTHLSAVPHIIGSVQVRAPLGMQGLSVCRDGSSPPDSQTVAQLRWAAERKSHEDTGSTQDKPYTRRSPMLAPHITSYWSQNGISCLALVALVLHPPF